MERKYITISISSLIPGTKCEGYTLTTSINITLYFFSFLLESVVFVGDDWQPVENLYLSELTESYATDYITLSQSCSNNKSKCLSCFTWAITSSPYEQLGHSQWILCHLSDKPVQHLHNAVFTIPGCIIATLSIQHNSHISYEWDLIFINMRTKIGVPWMCFQLI